MRTIQVVIDDDTLREADRIAAAEQINRSQLIRQALAAYSARVRERELEARHREGYAEHPVEAGEFDVWDTLLAADGDA